MPAVEPPVPVVAEPPVLAVVEPPVLVVTEPPMPVVEPPVLVVVVVEPPVARRAPRLAARALSEPGSVDAHLNPEGQPPNVQSPEWHWLSPPQVSFGGQPADE